MSELMGPKVRSRVMMGCQVVCIFLLLVIFASIVPHYLFPGQYRVYLWILTGLNLAVALLFAWRLPGHHAAARRPGNACAKPTRSWSGSWRHGPAAGGPVALAEPEPVAVPGGGRGEDQPVRRVRQELLGRHRIPAGGHGARLRRHVPTASAAKTFLFMVENRHYSAGFVFAQTAHAGVAAAAVYLLNALLGGRIWNANTPSSSAPSCSSPAAGLASATCTTPRACTSCTSLSTVGTILLLWSMYVYIPINYPTRMRSLGTGWTDGVGHLGAWGGVLLARSNLHRGCAAALGQSEHHPRRPRFCTC